MSEHDPAHSPPKHPHPHPEPHPPHHHPKPPRPVPPHRSSTTTVTIRPRRFYGTVQLDPARVGRDASRIADEVIAHLAGQVGANVTVTLEIAVTMPDGAPEQIVRTVTENSRTLRFNSHGFERE